MSVQSDIAEIRASLNEHESLLHGEARRSGRRLHNLLAAKLAAHGEALGLSQDEIVAFGGGTPKDEEPEG